MPTEKNLSNYILYPQPSFVKRRRVLALSNSRTVVLVTADLIGTRTSWVYCPSYSASRRSGRRLALFRSGNKYTYLLYSLSPKNSAASMTCVCVSIITFSVLSFQSSVINIVGTQNRIDKYTLLHSKPASSSTLCAVARTRRDNKPNSYACQQSRR